MTLPLVLRPAAEADIFAGRDWYNEQRDGLGESFVDAVRELLKEIQGEPERFAESFRHIRRAKTRRFPYVVCYRILADRTEVFGSPRKP